MKTTILCSVIILILATCFMVTGEGVEVTVTTKTYNGEFAPKNAVAIWVHDLETGEYLSTILLSTAAATYEGDELKNYTLNSGGENDYIPVDPVRNDHTQHAVMALLAAHRNKIFE